MKYYCPELKKNKIIPINTLIIINLKLRLALLPIISSYGRAHVYHRRRGGLHGPKLRSSRSQACGNAQRKFWHDDAAVEITTRATCLPESGAKRTRANAATHTISAIPTTMNTATQQCVRVIQKPSCSCARVALPFKAATTCCRKVSDVYDRKQRRRSQNTSWERIRGTLYLQQQQRSESIFRERPSMWKKLTLSIAQLL
ncbi:unnamed protein product [Trichogramma brassicae]|uniref:Uncharacterized protein n=1 Tax=Trichogramma brassicae TaxID=86971 RepID=A0A6H5IGL9_9HYME|nr:unnamed protein product [Trichogramma brassicae]